MYEYDRPFSDALSAGFSMASLRSGGYPLADFKTNNISAEVGR